MRGPHWYTAAPRRHHKRAQLWGEWGGLAAGPALPPHLRRPPPDEDLCSSAPRQLPFERLLWATVARMPQIQQGLQPARCEWGGVGVGPDR